MRRDVYIENDSGGFSVVAADAVDAIIEDQRSDDFGFVTSYKAMLIELYGDDSMPIRIVVDEPLAADEEAQWLARYSWRIDTSDGKMLAMGGFDPDVLSWWKESPQPNGDGRGIAAFTAAPGSWRVDVYAHVGSMNGRAILSESDSDEKPGAMFRASHENRPFPLWLAKMLEFSGDDDPGHEALWNDVKKSRNDGALAIDVDSGDAIGFLVHATRLKGEIGAPPESGWIDREANKRIPRVFPLGLRSEAPDPELRSFYEKLLDIKHPEPERPIADKMVEVIEVWSGDPLKKIDGGAVAVPVNDLYLLHWLASMTSDTAVRFELWIEPKGPWTPPTSTPDYLVTSKGRNTVAIGPVFNSSGWHAFWTARDVAKALTGIPDGSTIDFACAPIIDDSFGPPANPAVGRALYSGTVNGGVWSIAETSPALSRATLEQGLAFVREAVTNFRLQVKAGAERDGFDAQANIFAAEEGALVWNGDVVTVTDQDVRTVLLVAPPVFRARFAGAWPMDASQDEDDESDE